MWTCYLYDYFDDNKCYVYLTILSYINGLKLHSLCSICLFINHMLFLKMHLLIILLLFAKSLNKSAILVRRLPCWVHSNSWIKLVVLWFKRSIFTSPVKISTSWLLYCGELNIRDRSAMKAFAFNDGEAVTLFCKCQFCMLCQEIQIDYQIILNINCTSIICRILTRSETSKVSNSKNF